MRCPFCGNETTQVKDSRPAEDGGAIRRRRICGDCGGRFTTFERVQLRDLVVIKRDGRREAFAREKLGLSLNIALRKRPVEEEQIERMVSAILRRLEVSGESEVESREIGALAMDTLAVTDKIGYIRYASVYKDFDELADFIEFMDNLGTAEPTGAPDNALLPMELEPPASIVPEQSDPQRGRPRKKATTKSRNETGGSLL